MKRNNSRLFGNILKFVIISIVVLFSICVYRAYVVIQPCRHHIVKLEESDRIILEQDQLKHFQNALQYQTITFDDKIQNITAIEKYGQFIRNVFEEIEKYDFVHFEYVNNYSLLYTVQGSDKTLKPYLITAHMDVVGADNTWTFKPFDGEVIDSYIYGRGTLDDKGNMLSQLEAMKIFLKRYGQPKRTVYLAFGHDEEQTGLKGAFLIAQKLKNVELEYIIDEGLMVIEDAVDGFDKPGAFIGVAEKGYLTVKFYVKTVGGHSSVPNKKQSSIAILAEAINRLRENEHPSYLGKGPETGILESIGSEAGFFKRILFSNIWLFKPLLSSILSKIPTMDAMQRTTTSFTIFKSGTKDNVLPPYAEMTVNHRIHSLQSCKEVLEHDIKVINDDRVKYEVIQCHEPTAISPTNTLGYSLIKHTTKQLYHDAIPIPSVMLGATDSRHYLNSTRNIYKYTPILIKKAEGEGFHGKNERISVKNYENLINFYFNLLKNTDSVHLDKEKILNTEL